MLCRYCDILPTWFLQAVVATADCFVHLLLVIHDLESTSHDGGEGAAVDEVSLVACSDAGVGEDLVLEGDGRLGLAGGGDDVRCVSH